MREPSRRTVYCVRWDEYEVVKVGYSDESRWRIFEPRGARVLALWQFPSCIEALDHEEVCHSILEAVGGPAFDSKDQARTSRLLGSQGCGWTECFKVPARVTDNELLDLLTEGLVFA